MTEVTLVNEIDGLFLRRSSAMYAFIVLNILAIYSFQIPNELQIKMQNDIHNKFLCQTIEENLFPSS